MSIRKGDMVMVITGKEKGKTGKVLHVITERERAVVEKLNMVKRHMKPSPQYRQGGIIEKEASIHVSNLMLYDEKTKQASRIRHEFDDKGKKHRMFVKSGEKVGG